MRYALCVMRKKIAQIICAFPPYEGGMGNSAYHFAKFLSKHGHDVTTFTPLDSKHLTGFTVGKKINCSNTTTFNKVIALKPFLKYGHGAFLPQLFWHLKNFDIIYLHYPFFGAAEIIWLFKIIYGKKKKLIIHYHMDVRWHSMLFKILSIPSRLIQNSLFKKADMVISNSLDLVKYGMVANFYKKHPDKFCEIHYGIDSEVFKFDDSKSYNNQQKTILFVGGLDSAHYFKGIEILLQAVSKLQISNYKVLIAGGGDLQPKYEEQAKKLNVDNRVFFLGKVPNQKLPEIYQQADLFVLPSIKNESFGIVLLEAMSCGVPVIASNLFGVRTVFQNNIQGLLVEPGNVDDLKNKIERVLFDDKRLEQMGMAARKWVRENYSWEKAGNELNQVMFNV
ncbi:glycosyltransferase family 4 protein [Patescibacteria group bacterium]|nr:glycosyltransferase family 4 protein [Patescibacteria group bacterium]MBU1421169.1 glycosyltransferase family 4 protein [Patescibacteria group bacterium]